MNHPYLSYLSFQTQSIYIFSQMRDCNNSENIDNIEQIKIVFQEGKDCFWIQVMDEKKYIFGTETELQHLNIEDEITKMYIVSKNYFLFYRMYAFYFSNRSSPKQTISNSFLKTLLEIAVLQKASDIHLEIFEKFARIRLRIDGSLQILLEFEENVYISLVAQIKVFSNLDIVEKRLPQDGSFSLDVQKQKIDFRVSILPSIYGEKVVIRILDRNQTKFDLECLGFSQNQLRKVKEVLSKSSGLILNCGPTGSGKSSTLYSFLNYKKREDINIITVEDPVEYHLDGITQVACREDIGLDYPIILNSLLRQDPDVIMIGEIRDKKTAEIAIKAALTGHLVVSTIHAKDSSQCIERLCNLGIDPFLISISLQMILSQRLIKKLCSYCKQPSEQGSSNFYYEGIEIRNFGYEAKGCIHCQNRGYQGRVAIFEIFLCNEENQKWILSRASGQEKPKVESLLEDGLRRVTDGEISWKEVVKKL